MGHSYVYGLTYMLNIEFLNLRKQHSKRVRRLGDHKKRGLSMSAYVAGSVNSEGSAKLAGELASCHNWLLFRDYYEAGEVRLHRTISCRKHLLCPLCAILRAARSVRKYHERYEVIKSESPALRLYYVVLTVKNGVDLKERFTHMEKAVRMLVARRREALKAMGGSRRHAYALGSAFANVAGGAYSFEVKRGTGSGEWHPHANLLLLVDGSIDRDALIQEWESITGDSYIVHCEEKNPEDKGAFVEVFKYAMKFSEMECCDTYHAFETLRGRRLMGTFGAFRGVEVPEGDDEAIDSPYVELVYRYTGGRYRPAPEKAQVMLAPIEENAGAGGDLQEGPEPGAMPGRASMLVSGSSGAGCPPGLAHVAHLQKGRGSPPGSLLGSSLSSPVPSSAPGISSRSG